MGEVDEKAMRLDISIFVKRLSLIFILLAVLCISQTAYTQSKNVELLLERSPVRGGQITPSVGLHHFTTNSQVLLTAVPQPGYQFSYWLGDVGDPTSGRTTVYLNGSKVIVAVFEPIEERVLVKKKYVPAGSGGGGGSSGDSMLAAAADYSRHGFSGGGGIGRAQRHSEPVTTVFVPEPATVLLLTFGAVFLRKTRGPDGKKFI